MVMIAATGVQVGRLGQSVGGMFSTQLAKRQAALKIKTTPTGRFKVEGTKGPGFIKRTDAVARRGTLMTTPAMRMLGGGARFIPYIGQIITILSFLPMIYGLGKRFFGKSEEQMRKQDIASKLNFPVFSSELMSSTNSTTPSSG